MSAGVLTDSLGVTPPLSPGGDIGRPAVCGNGERCGYEPVPPCAYSQLRPVLEVSFHRGPQRNCASTAECAQEAGARLATGDTKVVNRGYGDWCTSTRAANNMAPIF